MAEKSLAQWLLRIIGCLLLYAAGLVILGWLQERDPDCFMDQQLFVQYRLCNEAFAGAPPEPSFLPLACAGLATLVGVLCLKLARGKAVYRDEDPLGD